MKSNFKNKVNWKWALSLTVLIAIIGTLLVSGNQPALAARNSYSQAAVPLAAVSIPITNSDAAGNQVSRFDINGNALDAHDGTLVLFGSTYYLYGTSYACGYEYQHNSNFCGFKVYSSPDLVHWTDRGFVVPPTACGYCFRPHVIYNASNNTYVLWSDAGGVYHVYTNNAPTGTFTLRPNPSLAVGGAVDEALFLDDNGTGYLIHNTTQVAAGLTADMVVEQLTPDFLNTTGAYVRLGLGDVEGFTVFKRNGVYHALMSDPTCAYCSGGTGEMTATSMLGPWSGAWYDPNGVHQSGSSEPRWRARLVNSNNCGGQPLASPAILQQDGTTAYYFVSDRWNNRKPNESLANFFIGPMTFDANGVLNTIQCVNSFTASLSVGSLGAYNVSPYQNQSSGFDGFRHYCDIQGNVQRQQSFTPSSTGTLSAVGITSFQDGYPNAPLLVDIVNSGGTVLSTSSVMTGAIPWAPYVVKVNPGVAVTAGQTYNIRLRSATTVGCYGFEYNDTNVYAGGAESYSTNSGGSFTSESTRDLKFTTEMGGPAPTPTPSGPWTYCAAEGGTCSFSGTMSVRYGANTSYFYQNATNSIACSYVVFGDPLYGTVKHCDYAPVSGPANTPTRTPTPGGPTPTRTPTPLPGTWTLCAAENATCSFSGTQVVRYGANTSYFYRTATSSIACTNAAFGGDPIPGTVKHCDTSPQPPNNGWTLCASENGTCSFSGTKAVGYGANGAFFYLTATTSIACNNAAFGDPIPNTAKSCYYK